ncbi:MAG TPA: NUDIX hydrolase [Pyrinomonadaceae bacterium]|nr:NUDIX hydrolase [Pyrinomonadaceae bacterium]
MEPEKIGQRDIYQGKILNVRIDRVREDGIEYDREIVAHNGSAVVVPVFEDGTVALVRQYRHAAGEYLLEIPAGSLEKGEDPKLGAARELEEEIGVVADSIEKLAEFYVSPGFLSELMHVFVATGLTEVGQKLEYDELLTVERYSFDSLLKMIRNGEIRDAKTICGVLFASERFR